MTHKTKSTKVGKKASLSLEQFVEGLRSCFVQTDYANWEDVKKYGLGEEFRDPEIVCFLVRAPFYGVARFFEGYKTSYDSTQSLSLREENKLFAGRLGWGGCSQRTRTYEGQPFDVGLENPPFSDPRRNVFPGISESDELLLDYNVLVTLSIDVDRQREVSEIRRNRALCGQFVMTTLDLIDHSIKNNWGFCIPFTDFGPVSYDPAPVSLK
ncbi:MAG: hypothetical protein V1659_03175 [Candidatus Woesearchaeota archaeon]